MKKILALALATTVTISLATGCGSTTTPSPSASPAASKPPTSPAASAAASPAAASAASTASAMSDTIIVGDNSDCKTLDPDGQIGAVEARVMTHIYEGLVKEPLKGATTVTPSLAESWTISPDGKTYTFKLKPNVKFSDGSAVTGADWIWSLERARDEKGSNSRSVAEGIQKITAPDATTLVIELKEPVASFLANLCKWNMVLKSKAHFDKVGAEGFVSKPLGTGPYALKEWKKNEYMDFVKNEYYHTPSPTAVKNLRYQIITDDNTRLIQLQAGQIDIAPGMPVNMMSQIAKDQNLAAVAYPSTQIRFLIFNASVAPFNNPKVREAAALLTNKQEIVELVAGGYAKPVASFVGENHGDKFNKDLKDEPTDVAKAKKLLADAGFANGVSATISIVGGNKVYEDIATILKEQWAQGGINLTIEPLESGTLIAKLEKLGHNATLLQWTESVPDPNDICAYACRYADSQQWYSGLKNQDIEKLYLSTIFETDAAKRAANLQKLQKDVYDLHYLIPLFQADYTYGVSKKIQGLNVTPFNKFNSTLLTKSK